MQNKENKELLAPDPRSGLSLDELVGRMLQEKFTTKPLEDQPRDMYNKTFEDKIIIYLRQPEVANRYSEMIVNLP